jgi:hypothetical protein
MIVATIPQGIRICIAASAAMSFPSSTGTGTKTGTMARTDQATIDFGE